MSSLRLVHSKNHPTPGVTDPADVAESSSSARLQSMVEKVYKLEIIDVSAIEVFDQLVDDLLAEARGDSKPVRSGP